jgi:hypothetical protein
MLAFHNELNCKIRVELVGKEHRYKYPVQGIGSGTRQGYICCTLNNPYMSTNVSNWMSWEGGVDLVAVTSPDLQMPNVIVHLARMVHTPVGSAPSGMVFWQPDPAAMPLVMGFVSTDAKVGAYFGPHIFAGTPFEAAPVLEATIDIQVSEAMAYTKCVVAGHTFEVEMSNLGTPYLINREPAAMPPFHQQGVERVSGNTVLKVNGQPVHIIIPPVGITGGPASVVAPCGLYAR